MQNQIPENWQKVKLGEVSLLNPTVSMSQGLGFSYIPMEDLDWNKKYVDPKTTKDFKNGSRFEEGDVLFARITPCLENGKVGRARGLSVGKGFGSTEYFVIRGKNAVTDTDYLYYLSRTYRLRRTAINSMLGASGRQRADIQSLKDFELYLPTLKDQKQIASVLSAFDDKIEVNNKIAKTLEEMSQAIFKERFVNFKFPGYKKTKFVDSNLGKIPQRWKVKNLFDIATVTYGYPFKSKRFNERGSGTKLIRIRNLTNGNTSTYTPETADCKYVVQNGDILVGMDGTFYIRKWAAGKAYLNQRVAMFRPKRGISWLFLFLSIKGPIKRKESEVGGTTVAHLSDKDLRGMNFPLPPRDLMDNFLKFDAMYEKQTLLDEENQKLAEMRDLFLPKLMKGEIRV